MSRSIANVWVLVALIVLTIVFNRVLFPMTTIPGGSLDAQRWGWSVADARAKVDGLSDADRTRYLNQERFTDLVFPIVYGAMLAIALVLLRGPRWTLLLPLVGVIADYFENFSIIGMLITRDAKTFDRLAEVGSAASRFKWVHLTEALIAIAVLAGVRFTNRLFSGPSSAPSRDAR